ncbi:hypothetical protein E3P99_00560 [Wallemia hederae]|uniref:Striatin N-terminal domain-containing protein n=1 Tax=Wallemia hederae TaxID=1540922 RepID=A0A4T0FXM0_9BASI|nr:hypothetical protein E3P99_00560 [Wallemia hederae]
MSDANPAAQTENNVVWRTPQYYNVKKKQLKHSDQQQQQPGSQSQQPSQTQPEQPNISPQQLIPRSTPPQQPSETTELSLANILHYLQSEWRRYDRDRNEWEIERAEMRARLALLEGEKRATDNVKSDLLRRVRMLEYALRQERAKFIALSHPRSASPKSANSNESNSAEKKDDKNAEKSGVSAIHPTKKASLNNDGSDSQKSDDSPLLSSTNTLTNHAHNNSSLPQWLRSTNHSKDTKTRTKSRQYLQQCLEEITYLTDPSTLNPLTGRPHKDAEGLEIEKLPQSVPMESSSPSNSVNKHSSDKINEQLSNTLTNSITIEDSAGGPIVSQPLVETEETVRAQLAAPSSPSSPPAISSSIANKADEGDHDAQSSQASHQDQDEEDDVTVVDQDHDTAHDVGDVSAETTFTQSSHADQEKDTTQVNDSHNDTKTNEDDKDNEDEDGNKSKDKDNQNLIKPEDPMNADVPPDATPNVEDDANEVEVKTQPLQSTEDVATPTHESSNPTEDANANAIANGKVEVPAIVRGNAKQVNALDEDSNVVNTFDDSDSIRSGTSSLSSVSAQGLWRSCKTLKSHIDAVRAVAFAHLPAQASDDAEAEALQASAQHQLLITGGDDAVLKYWRIPIEADDESMLALLAKPSVNLRGHTAPITALAVSQTRPVVYTGSIDTTLREWLLTDEDGDVLDLATLTGRVFEGHTDGIWGLASTATGKLVSAGSDAVVKVWDEKTGQLEHTLSVDRPCSSLYLHEEVGEGGYIVKTLLVVGLTDGSALLVDLEHPDFPHVKFVVDDAEHGSNAQFNDVILDSDKVYSAHEDGKIRLWLLPGGQRIETLIAHLDSCTAIKFQPDSQILASASHDCSIRFWSTDKFSQIHSPGVAHDACVQECGGHKKAFGEGVNGIAFNQHGSILASAGADGSIKLYCK